MNIQSRCFLAAAVLILTSLVPVHAEVGVSVEFSSDEIRIISAWYREHGEDAPGSKKGKGGGKSRGFPPGVAKNLARGKPLPPGIAKKALPTGLDADLPPPTRGFERVIIDGRVVLVEIATQMIHDILSDAILR